MKSKVWRKRLLGFSTLTLVLAGFFSVVLAETDFTVDEMEFINNSKPLKVAYVIGAAPIQYKNAREEAAGISYEVLKVIEEKTQLKFEIVLLDPYEPFDWSTFDIIAGMPETSEDQTGFFTIPYLRTQESLFINKDVSITSTDDLSDHIYGYTQIYNSNGLTHLPSSKRYASQQELMLAVNNGEADYGLASSYTISYYITQYDLRNIYTMPSALDETAYCFYLHNDNPNLLSILNKSIMTLDNATMNNIMISSVSKGQANLTWSDFYEQVKVYFFLIFVIFTAFTLWVNYTLQKNRRTLAVDNEQYRILTNLSDELLFQYNTDEYKIDFKGKASEKFKSNPYYVDLQSHIKRFLRQGVSNGVSSFRFESSLSDTIVLQIYHYHLENDSNIIIGKIKDITEDVQREEYLINQSRKDGLTSLYNAKYTKESIQEFINTKPKERIDALVLVDMDDFKLINDTYGHLKGDYLLQEVSLALQNSFKNSKIIGRVGGDEFVVYVEDIDFDETECEAANHYLQTLNDIDFPIPITSSIGISIITNQISYEQVFQEADYALYEAKHTKNRIKIYQEVTNG